MAKPNAGLAVRIGCAAVILSALTACRSPPRMVAPARPALSPTSVVVYQPPLLPRHYTVMAKLDATGYGGWSSRGVDRIVLQRLRREAAGIGANGILLIPIPFANPQRPNGTGGKYKPAGCSPLYTLSFMLKRSMCIVVVDANVRVDCIGHLPARAPT